MSSVQSRSVLRPVPPPVAMPTAPAASRSSASSWSLGGDSYTPSRTVPPPVYQPTPPPVDQPTPPPVDQPTPPPVDQPTPPPIDRPTPPPVLEPVPPPIARYWVPPGYQWSNPQAVFSQFEQAKSQVEYAYNNTDMTSSQKDDLENQLADRAAQELVALNAYPMQDRLSVLNEIYNDSPMSSSTLGMYQSQLTQQAIGSVISSFPATFSSPEAVADQFLQAKSQVDTLYNSTNMTSSQENDLENQLAERAAGQLVAMTGASVEDRISALNTIYNSSPMSSDTFNFYSQQIAQQAVSSW